MSDTVNLTVGANSINSTTGGNSLTANIPTDSSNANLTDITDTVLIVENGETKTIPNGELFIRQKAIVDGDLIIDGKLQIKQ